MKYEEPFMLKREQPAEQQERAWDIETGSQFGGITGYCFQYANRTVYTD